MAGCSALWKYPQKCNNSWHFIIMAGKCVRIPLPGLLNPVQIIYIIGKSIQVTGCFFLCDKTPELKVVKWQAMKT